MAELARVLSILPKDFDASLLWRNWWPIEELIKHDVVADWCYVDRWSDDVEPRLRSGRYNTVVTPRFIFREQWMLTRFRALLQHYDITWIYELDDDLLSDSIIDRNVAFKMAQTNHPELSQDEKFKYLNAGYQFQRQMHIQQLGYVDGVTVSTQPLAHVVSEYTSAPIEIIPNAMNLDWFMSRKQKITRRIPALTIGWSGGWRYDADLSILAEAWATIAKRHPSIEFVLYGYQSPSIMSVIPPERLHIISWSDLDEYPGTLTNIDIGCCSIADNSWNLNKTPIKWFEMTMAGAACVVSHALYGKTVTDGVDGLLATTTDQWVNQLEALIMLASLRRTLHDEAVKTIRNQHTIQSIWPMWISAWSNIRIQSTSNQYANKQYESVT